MVGRRESAPVPRTCTPFLRRRQGCGPSASLFRQTGGWEKARTLLARGNGKGKSKNGCKNHAFNGTGHRGELLCQRWCVRHATTRHDLDRVDESGSGEGTRSKTRVHQPPAPTSRTPIVSWRSGTTGVRRPLGLRTRAPRRGYLPARCALCRVPGGEELRIGSVAAKGAIRKRGTSLGAS